MKGIAFSAEMAQAIYEGRKTQTRRVMEPQPKGGIVEIKPRYKLGEILYVKEPWRVGAWNADQTKAALDYTGFIRKELLDIPPEKRWMFFKNLCSELLNCGNFMGVDGIYRWEPGESPLPWQNPLFMPRWAARSFVKITDIKVERLRDITEANAEPEGVLQMCANEMHTIPTCIVTRLMNLETSCQTLGFVDMMWVYTFNRVENGE